MHNAFRPVVGLIFLLPCLAAAEPLPSSAELYRLFDEGKYAAVLQKLPPVLVLKGEAAKVYDRHDLLRLKGEAHLRVGAQAAAAKAFADAALATQDAKAAGLDLATALLIQRSGPNLAYSPAAQTRAAIGKPAAGPLPVVEPVARKAALSALLADEVSAAEPKVDAARRATDLLPVLDVLAVLRDLKALESAATGGRAEATRLLGRLESGVGPLLSDAVRDAALEVDWYEAYAGQLSPYVKLQIGGSGDGPQPKSAATRDLSYPGRPNAIAQGGGGLPLASSTRPPPAGASSPVQANVGAQVRGWRQRGVVARDARSLNDLIARLEAVTAACKELAPAATTTTDYAAIAVKSYETARRADSVLRTDFTHVYHDYPGKLTPAADRP